jgi:hypothetical protein
LDKIQSAESKNPLGIYLEVGMVENNKLDRIAQRQGRNRVSWYLVHLHSKVLVSQNRDAAEHAKICFALISLGGGRADTGAAASFGC